MMSAAATAPTSSCVGIGLHLACSSNGVLAAQQTSHTYATEPADQATVAAR